MRNTKGFTYIEIMIALGILALLAAAIVLPAVKKNIENAESGVCAENRRVVEHSEQRFLLDNSRHSDNFQELIDGGYLKQMPECPSDGVYAWTSTDAGDAMYKTQLGCSVHSAIATTPIVEPPVVEPPPVEPPVVEPPVVEPPGGDKGGGKDKDKDKDKDKGGPKK